MKITSLTQAIETPTSHTPELIKKVIIGHGVVPRLTNFSAITFEPGQVAANHVHKDMYEIFFVEEGSGLLKQGSVNHGITAGDCIIVEPGDEHEIVNSSEFNLKLLFFGVEKR